VARVRALEQERLRVHSQNEVDDAFERNVVMVRTLVVAPAEVQADAVRRHVGERMVERLDVQPGASMAKIILNARTGSVVMNQAVTVDVCAISHGNLSVVITSEPIISQPGPFSNGRTVVTQSADIQLKQEGNGFKALPTGTKLADVVRALNTLGATPQDLLAILQAMKSAGALKAELEII
jgi:flagellar P-ring protein precursor FlgI